MLKKTFSGAVDLVLISIIYWLIYNGYVFDFPLFNPDEGRYSEISREMLQSGDFITPYLNGLVFLEKPVGYFWLQATSFKLFGITEWAARLPNLFLAFIGVLATYIFSRMWFNQHTARWAALIILSTPLYFGAAHYANLDLPLAIFITLSLNCLITAFISSSLSQKSIFCRLAYFFAGCAFLIKGLIALVFPFLLTVCWIIVKKRLPLLKEMYFISGSIIFLCVVLPWCICMQMRHPEFFDVFFLHEQFGRYLSQADFNNKSPAWFFLPVVLVGVFPWSALLVQALWKNIRSVFYQPNKHPVECLLLIWFTCILVFFSIPKSKLVGYMLPTLPPLAILVAHWLNQYERQNKKSKVFILSAVFLLAIEITLGFFIYNFPHLPITFPNKYKLYAWSLIAACMGCSLFLAYPFQLNRIKKLFYAHFLLALFSIMVFLLFVPAFQRNSLRQFSLQLRPFLLEHPQSEVIIWNEYAYDLPFYLNRTIQVAGEWSNRNFEKDNWQREFSRAANFTRNQTTLIEAKEVLQAYAFSCHSRFLITNEYHARFVKKPFVFLMERDGYTVFWNGC